MLIQHFQMLARYNTLANRKLYEVCSQLSDVERKCIRPAFFKSIHGTLNHIMVGDSIWMGRFEGKQMPSTNLDAILYDDFDELRSVRVLEDERIEAFMSELEQDFVTKTISYVNNQGKLHTDPANLLLAHFFNHQTHHRGQIHDMLTQTEIAPPILDMHRIIRP
ncbi:DinB family protein [Brasilonema sp. UFV-L1]|uniref:DinB family protein n=1 Tax=Brasilonema sp. UFV-L1 TaxID=2234130 RepID=UPI00145DC7AF|nr:DinB family protein [Brasilonema sp. UFV-L1]NMG11834.1 damage-inducible protein DinB [Brasilonema sp. UFV-L1]